MVKDFHVEGKSRKISLFSVSTLIVGLFLFSFSSHVSHPPAAEEYIIDRDHSTFARFCMNSHKKRENQNQQVSGFVLSLFSLESTSDFSNLSSPELFTLSLSFIN